MVQNERTFRLRMNVMLGFIFCWCGVIVFRLVHLQIYQQEAMKERTDSLHHTIQVIPARRGEVRDAKGKVLAISNTEPGITADPSMIEDPVAATNTLAKILGKGGKWKKVTLKRFANKRRRFCYVEKRITEAQAAEVDAADLHGVFINQGTWRKYPNGWTASHIMGFTNQDGTVKEGLESQYDEVMKGAPGKREVMRDGRRRTLSLNATVLKEPEIGANLHLTIDANIQLFVEEALRRAYHKSKAKNITAIVVDPRNGEIKAMANMPDFNPNHYNKYNFFERKNRAVVDVYEPASAFKIITVAAALDSGTLDLDAVVFCENGGIQVYDKRIRDHKRFGELSVSEILWYSSNVGAIKVAQTMEPDVFYRYIANFGFGEKTGIDLPAESKGILRPVSEWSKVSPAFLSMGHEISSTPLQMLMAAAAVANEGKRVTPFVVAEIEYADGSVKDLRPKDPPVQVIRKETADKLIGALKGVVERGTAKAAAIPGVEVFGKTGTAQRIHGGSYSRSRYNSSFVGFFPAEAPRYGIIVVVHDPKGRRVEGGAVAAPIFSEIGKQIVLYEQDKGSDLVVTQRAPQWPTRALERYDNYDAMPDLIGLGIRNLLYQCRRLELNPEIQGEGKVVSQSPQPGEPLTENRNIKVVLTMKGEKS